MTKEINGPRETADDGSDNSRGAIIRLFGVILIILGALNSMLSWRGGFDFFSFQVLLFAVGLLLCLIGTIRNQSRH